MSARSIPTKDAAKLIRAELRAAFPAVRFSVRCSTGTGSAWINVYWTDGPTDSQVRAIVGQFTGRSFDGMTDTYLENDHTLVARADGQMPETVSYHCDGVNVHRTLSPAAALEAQRIIRTDSNIRDVTICDDDGTLVRGTLAGPDRTVIIAGRPFDFPWLDARLAVWHVMGGRDLTP